MPAGVRALALYAGRRGTEPAQVAVSPSGMAYERALREYRGAGRAIVRAWGPWCAKAQVDPAALPAEVLGLPRAWAGVGDRDADRMHDARGRVRAYLPV